MDTSPKSDGSQLKSELADKLGKFRLSIRSQISGKDGQEYCITIHRQFLFPYDLQRYDILLDRIN